MKNFSILKTTKELLSWRTNQKKQVYFVPTMGGLHFGHGELIRASKGCGNPKNNNVVLVSVFVNPLQFGDNEDYSSYPRNLDTDIAFSKNAGANAIWAPSFEDVFPEGLDSHFKVHAPIKLQENLCGANRPGHFDGVATVVTRLLSLVKPNSLTLGEKDWQQYVILRKLVKELGLPIKVFGVATARESNGLAYSSRNQYLNNKERLQALILKKELGQASKDYLEGKKLDLSRIHASFEKEGLKVEYLSLVNPKDLQSLDQATNLSLLATAVRCGTTRLIDHCFLMTRKPIVAIDGPAGAGKSTVTRAFAKQMGLLYLDTGAMYRAVTWLLQQKNISPLNEEQIIEELSGLSLELIPSNKAGNGPKVIINQQEITTQIRSPEVTAQVSSIASHRSVRTVLTKQQQLMGKKGGLVAEGRDICTTVFPDAEVKIFLTASTKERARRRAKDLRQQGFSQPDLQQIEAEILERDRLDSTRDLSPLIQSKDSTKLITDGMNIEEVIESIITIFREKIPQEVWPSPH